MSAAFLVLLLAVTACTGDDSSDETSADVISGAVVPGLSPEDEVVLVRTAPEQASTDYVWTQAYRVGDLPAINVGRPGPSLWQAAGREPSPDFICAGGEGSIGCGLVGGETPNVVGVSFGGLFVVAWTWIGVPHEAVAVQFTDQDRTVAWQRPLDGVVVFPHTVPNDDVGECACRFDALSAAGEVLVAVDVGTAQYVSVP